MINLCPAYYRHNVKVVNTGRGVFVPAKAQSSSKTYCSSDYVPCNACKGFFVKSDLRRHRCKFAKNEKPTVKAGLKLLRKELGLLNEPKASEAVMSILANWKDDTILNAVKDDAVILDMLALKCHRGITREKWIANLRYEVRLLGRFIIEARKLIPGAETLTDILRADNFDAIAAASELCSTSKKPGNENETTSVALNIGNAIKKATDQLMSMSLINKDDSTYKQGKEMLKVMASRWQQR